MPSLLKREINVAGAMFMGMGSIIGTGIFVSIALGTQIAGNSVLAAILFAAILALFNGLSSAQLAAAHPVSGGTYEYGNHFLNSWFGFTAGWMFMIAKSASAATAVLGTAAYLFYLFGIETGLGGRITAGLVLLIGMTLLVQGGIRRSDKVNRWIISVTLLGLIIFVATAWITHGLPGGAFTEALQQLGWTGLQDVVRAEQFIAENNPTLQAQAPSGKTTLPALFYATALMFVAYTGYGRIATLGEEVKNPARTIPRAIMLTMTVVVILYLSVTSTVLDLIGAESFAGTLHQKAAPLVAASDILGSRWVSRVLAISAVTAMAGVLLNLLLGLSRVLLSMSRRKDMPSIFKTVNSETGSPKAAVWGSAGIIALLVSTGSIQFTWTFSAVTVLIYYAITNLAALRLKREDRRYPAWIPAAGLAGCLFLTIWIEAAVWIPAGVLIAAGWGWHAIARSKQKNSPPGPYNRSSTR